MPRGIDALRKERTELVDAMTAVDDLSDTAHRVVLGTEDGLVTNLENLRPLTKQLADKADVLADTVDEVSYPLRSGRSTRRSTATTSTTSRTSTST